MNSRKLVVEDVQPVEDYSHEFGVKYDTDIEEEIENDGTKMFPDYNSAKKYFDEYEGECALWEFTPMPELIACKEYEE